MGRRTASFKTSTLVVILLALPVTGCDDDKGPDPVCVLTISPASREFPSEGGEGGVTVTLSHPSCEWAASASADWVTIPGGATGTGSGAVSYRVAENAQPGSRTANLAIGDAAHVISQQGRPAACTYEIEPSSASFRDAGGTGTFNVTAPDGCAWTATSSAPFVTITGGAAGNGSGTVAFQVAENNDPDDRTATIAVADRTFSIAQSAESVEPVECEYRVAPVEFTPCMPAGSVTTQVTAPESCPWTASTDVPWLTIVSGSSDTGSGPIRFSFSANYEAPRTGIVMVRWPAPTQGQNVRVRQAGCQYGVSQSMFAIGVGGGNGTFTVLQQSDPYECGGATQDRCIWSAVSSVPWITISGSMPRQGDDQVAFTVAPNGTGQPRAGTITVRDRVIQVQQSN
jgi:hypothetical protein